MKHTCPDLSGRTIKQSASSDPSVDGPIESGLADVILFIKTPLSRFTLRPDYIGTTENGYIGSVRIVSM